MLSLCMTSYNVILHLIQFSEVNKLIYKKLQTLFSTYIT